MNNPYFLKLQYHSNQSPKVAPWRNFILKRTLINKPGAETGWGGEEIEQFCKQREIPFQWINVRWGWCTSTRASRKTSESELKTKGNRRIKANREKHPLSGRWAHGGQSSTHTPPETPHPLSGCLRHSQDADTPSAPLHSLKQWALVSTKVKQTPWHPGSAVMFPWSASPCSRKHMVS